MSPGGTHGAQQAVNNCQPPLSGTIAHVDRGQRPQGLLQRTGSPAPSGGREGFQQKEKMGPDSEGQVRNDNSHHLLTPGGQKHQGRLPLWGPMTSD